MVKKTAVKKPAGFDNFKAALRKIVQVPKSEIDGTQKPKRRKKK